MDDRVHSNSDNTARLHSFNGKEIRGFIPVVAISRPFFHQNDNFNACDDSKQATEKIAEFLEKDPKVLNVTIQSDDAFPQPPFNLAKVQPRFAERKFHYFNMGDLCTAKRFHQALRDIILATQYYGINESVVESHVTENSPMEDLVSIKNYRLEKTNS